MANGDVVQTAGSFRQQAADNSEDEDEDEDASTSTWKKTRVRMRRTEQRRKGYTNKSKGDSTSSARRPMTLTQETGKALTIRLMVEYDILRWIEWENTGRRVSKRIQDAECKRRVSERMKHGGMKAWRMVFAAAEDSIMKRTHMHAMRGLDFGEIERRMERARRKRG